MHAERPVRKTERLRRGRETIPGATYFITACIQNRAPVLVDPTNALTLLDAWQELAAASDITPLAFTIMPDHCHGLFALGERLSLARVVAKLKTRGRPAGASWSWQDNVFEHRLRAKESAEDYAFYIFMNAYRAGLISTDQRWPRWQGATAMKWDFENKLSPIGTPPPEWLEQMVTLRERVTTR